jgi:PAS domain S-box-containing protein
MRILYAARNGRADTVKAAKTLIADDGALARWPGPVALVKAGGAVVCANEPARRIESLFGAGAADRLAPAIGDALAANEARSVTLTLPGPDGGESQIELSVMPLARGGYGLVMGRMVTAATAAHGAVAAARRRYRDLLALTGDFAWETDATGVFTFVSEAGGFGWKPEELIGRRASEFLIEPAAGPDPFAARAPVRDLRLAVRRADGGVASVIVSALPIADAARAWCGARGIAREDAGGQHGAADSRERLIEQLMQLADEDAHHVPLPARATG